MKLEEYLKTLNANQLLVAEDFILFMEEKRNRLKLDESSDESIISAIKDLVKHG